MEHRGYLGNQEAVPWYLYDSAYIGPAGPDRFDLFQEVKNRDESNMLIGGQIPADHVFHLERIYFCLAGGGGRRRLFKLARRSVLRLLIMDKIMVEIPGWLVVKVDPQPLPWWLMFARRATRLMYLCNQNEYAGAAVGGIEIRGQQNFRVDLDINRGRHAIAKLAEIMVVLNGTLTRPLQ